MKNKNIIENNNITDAEAFAEKIKMLRTAGYNFIMKSDNPVEGFQEASPNQSAYTFVYENEFYTYLSLIK